MATNARMNPFGAERLVERFNMDEIDAAQMFAVTQFQWYNWKLNNAVKGFFPNVFESVELSDQDGKLGIVRTYTCEPINHVPELTLSEKIDAIVESNPSLPKVVLEATPLEVIEAMFDTLPSEKSGEKESRWVMKLVIIPYRNRGLHEVELKNSSDRYYDCRVGFACVDLNDSKCPSDKKLLQDLRASHKNEVQMDMDGTNL